MSADRRLPATDYRGESPCVPPHVLCRLLEKLQPLKARLRNEQTASENAWAAIDALAKRMEAMRP